MELRRFVIKSILSGLGKAVILFVLAEYYMSSAFDKMLDTNDPTLDLYIYVPTLIGVAISIIFDLLCSYARKNTRILLSLGISAASFIVSLVIGGFLRVSVINLLHILPDWTLGGTLIFLSICVNIYFLGCAIASLLFLGISSIVNFRKNKITVT